MKQTHGVWKLSIITMMLIAVPLSGTQLRSTGLGLRGGFWNLGNESTFLRYVRENGHERIETGGVGGWIYFFSRTSEHWNIEFALGAFAQTEGESLDEWDETIEGTAIIPIILGFQRELFSVANSSSLRPYLSFGGGPYWVTDIQNDEFYDREEVLSKILPGAFLGGGVHFLLGQSLGLNFDLKYHAVDLSLDDELSGLEVGLGLSIMWGTYNLASHQR
jgi:hypothetical protein